MGRIMADRIISETMEIRRVRNVPGERKRDQVPTGDKHQDAGEGRHPARKRRRQPRKGGGIDEFA